MLHGGLHYCLNLKTIHADTAAVLGVAGVQLLVRLDCELEQCKQLASFLSDGMR